MVGHMYVPALMRFMEFLLETAHLGAKTNSEEHGNGNPEEIPNRYSLHLGLKGYPGAQHI